MPQHKTCLASKRWETESLESWQLLFFHSMPQQYKACITSKPTKKNGMSFLAGSPGQSWNPVMTSNTTEPSYWLNWRFFVCGLAVLSSMVAAAQAIWRRESFLVTVRGSGRRREREREEEEESLSSDLRSDEAWSTCLKGIHPVWLLAYRIVAFVALFSLLFANVLIDGPGIFYFYTQ